MRNPPSPSRGISRSSPGSADLHSKSERSVEEASRVVSIVFPEQQSGDGTAPSPDRVKQGAAGHRPLELVAGIRLSSTGMPPPWACGSSSSDHHGGSIEASGPFSGTIRRSSFGIPAIHSLSNGRCGSCSWTRRMTSSACCLSRDLLGEARSGLVESHDLCRAQQRGSGTLIGTGTRARPEPPSPRRAR